MVQGTELYVDGDGDNGLTVITAQARNTALENNGYSFVHCSITGTGKGTFLGRAWKNSPNVVFANTEMSNVVNPEGWSDKNNHDRQK